MSPQHQEQPMESYADKINKPLSPATVQAINEQLASGNYARYRKGPERRAVKVAVAAEVTTAGHPFAAAKWLIWSNTRQKWWGPNQCDYTHEMDEAGRYSWVEACEIFEQTNRGWDPSTSPDLPSVFLVVAA